MRFVLFHMLALLTLPAFAADEPFDVPLAVDEVRLAADPANPSAERRITCQRYPEFAIKEVDFGEVGAERIAILTPDAPCTEAASGESVITHEMAGYYLGAKGSYLFLQTPDGWNGGLPFVVLDAKTQQAYFDDSAWLGADGTAQLFRSIELTPKGLTLTFSRVYTAPCSLRVNDPGCDRIIREATGLAVLPDCTKAYEAEKKRVPDYTGEVDATVSVITYAAKLTLEDGAVSREALGGEVSCGLEN
jgi:hypothetical protein